MRDMNSPTNTLPILSTRGGWVHQSHDPDHADRILGGDPTTDTHALPILPGITGRYTVSNTDGNDILEHVQTVRRFSGWQRPGPGPGRGRARIPNVGDLRSPFLLGLIHLTKEAVHFQQLYCFSSTSHDASHISLTTVMSHIDEVENTLTVSKVMRKNIWTVTHQLGVPGFLIRLKSPYHAVVMHFLPDRRGYQWACSLCTDGELGSNTNCSHARLMNECVSQIAGTIQFSNDNLLCSMTQSAAFHHIPDLPLACFYGSGSRLEFSIIRDRMTDQRISLTSQGRIYIAKRISITHGWKCLYRACSGRSKHCIHRRTVDTHVDRGFTHCFPNIHFLLASDRTSTTEEDETDGNSDYDNTTSYQQHYNRPIIPFETAFNVDFDVNKHARNGTSIVLRASSTCHCGFIRTNETVTPIFRVRLRVESSRCFVDYEQEVWKCSNGHCVTPEHDARTREGIFWISRDTAYTEAFLFDLLLHMTVGGATISSQADLRAQMISLQTHFMSEGRLPRSKQSLRKALIMYSMAVVQSIPRWVFRCSKYAIVTGGTVHYDKLSFDGQQIGFNIRKDVRYDFYGKPAAHWRRPVDRDSHAASIPFLLQSRPLRMIVMEALRVREIPTGCNSVQSLCRAMMTVSLRSKDTIRAAVGAIKLLDVEWEAWLLPGTPTTIDTSLVLYLMTADEESSAHPVRFITNNVRPSQHEFEHATQISNIFKAVLDCKRAGQVLSVILNELRGDLKSYIPTNDRDFIRRYAQHSGNNLHEWLSQISKQNSWPMLVPSMTQHEVEESVSLGVSEHAAALNHPFRPPFSWNPTSNHTTTNDLVTFSVKSMLSNVRKIGIWSCPYEAQVSIQMLFMALLVEPVNVWLRNGDFTSFSAAIELLSAAEIYCGTWDTQHLYQAAFQSVHSITLLYEGLMGIIGANEASAIPMLTTTRKVFEMVMTKHEAYEEAMRQSSSAKQFMCSPREFDDMLLWTGAVPNSFQHNNPEHDGQLHSTEMRDLYNKLARAASNDFLKTGIWAPDFPIRRPSLSASLWGADMAHTESSCSKNFGTNSDFSPGTFGAYCLCKHSKTLMVSFLKRPEGCRMPINILVERCAQLPRYVVYDFACGTAKAALALSARISRHTRFVIDPFHFPGHKTCSLAMHEATYSDLRGCNTESQEQRNSSIRVMERTLRASRDVHFMHFVVLAHAYLNLKAMYLDHQDAAESSPENSENDYGSRAWIRWIRDTLMPTFSESRVDD